MSKYEQMENKFFSRVKNGGAAGCPFRPHQLAQEFELETRHVREKLIQWAEAGYISLDAWTGEGGHFRPFSDWRSTDEFFEHGNKEVRAKLLVAGDEHFARLQEIKQRPIGF